MAYTSSIVMLLLVMNGDRDMNRYVALISHCFSIALFTTCPILAHSQPTERAKLARDRVKVEHNIEGQAFVVTKDRSNIRLAIMNVAVHKEIDGLKLFGAAEEARALSKNYAKLKALYAELYGNLDSIQKSLNMEASGSAKYLELRAKYDQIAEEWSTTGHELEALKISCSKRPLVHHIEAMRDPITAARTDVDGSFKFKLPAGAYLLIASTDRQVGATRESYYWAVKVDLGKSSQKVILSNHNMVDLAPESCGS